MPGVNTISKRNVPIFLSIALCVLFSLLCACDGQGVDDGDSGLDAREIFVVEQYLRLLEARRMVVDQDSLAADVFTFLEQDLPADSLRGAVAEISSRDPERWPLIFEEIVRRKKIMMDETR